MILSLSALFAFAAAQCTPDLLVDNYASVNRQRCVECGLEPDGTYPLRFFNLVGGDYGAKDSTISVSGGSMRMVSTWGPADTSEKMYSPGAPTAHNYWYVKFDAVACFNLARYRAIQFDVKAPAGADFYIALTQKSADCRSRETDSVYKNMTEYITPNGQFQTLTLPVSDFSTNLLNRTFDMAHLKDFTLVNLTPGENYAIEFRNMVLKGNCTTSSSVTGGTPLTTTAGSAPTSTPTRNGDWMAAPIYSFLGLVGLFL